MIELGSNLGIATALNHICQYALNNSGVHKTERIITSATLTNILAWKDVGGFDEELFVDGVDKDFCFRLRKKGYYVLVDCNICLLHELGNLRCRRILGHTIYVTNHSANRRYFMIRNSIYIRRKLGIGRPAIIYFKNLFKIVVFEGNKMEKIKSMNKGLADGMKNKMGRVLIIVSTYNGEMFIREQLDSLLSQTYPVFILIRDDGSSDGTIHILREYEKNNSNIIVLEGENIGVVNSFNEMINNKIVDEFEYIAFCDQDDVWDSDKVMIAVKWLENKNNTLPLLYCSNLNVVDQNLNFIRKMRKNPRFTKTSALVQNIGTGCTEVFNYETVKLYRKAIGKYMEIHDYFIYLICIYFGIVLYDSDAHISYRQHDNNVIGTNKIGIKQALANTKKEGKRQRTLVTFLEAYKNYLKKDDIDRIECMINYKRSIAKRMRIFLDPRFRGNIARVTIGFKVRVLLGKVY